MPRPKGVFLPFQKARAIVLKLGLKSQKEWREWSKSGERPTNIPSSPHQVYRDKGWVNTADWLGYDRKKKAATRGKRRRSDSNTESQVQQQVIPPAIFNHRLLQHEYQSVSSSSSSSSSPPSSSKKRRKEQEDEVDEDVIDGFVFRARKDH